MKARLFRIGLGEGKIKISSTETKFGGMLDYFGIDWKG